MAYTSSNIKSYGDLENVKRDAKIVNEILSRQGSGFLIDLIAEHAGHTANTYRLTLAERQNIVSALRTELDDALSERV